MNSARELEIAKALAAEAGAKLLHFRSELAVEGAQDRRSGEVLAVAGFVADDVICSGLADAFPDDSLCSRRSGRQAGWTGRVWLVEALDSDQNYLARGDEFTVSIGLAVHGKAVLGVIFNPLRQEMFAGRIGLGASLNGERLPIQVSVIDEQKPVLVPQAEFQTASAFCQGRIKLVPSASLSYSMARVAAGMVGGIISLRTDAGYSTCSGTALIEAAGGRASLLNGGDVFYRSDEMVQPAGVIAAAPSRHALLLAILRDLQGLEWETGADLDNVA